MNQANAVVIAFGANLGDRGATIRQAANELAATAGFSGFKLSPLYETIALTASGPDPAAPAYLNAVGTALSTLSPQQVLNILQGIENRHGRVRESYWGDRTLDLDLIVYGTRVINTATLQVPHPRAHCRDFVLAPWLHLDPAATLPGHGSISDLLRQLGDTTRRLDPAPQRDSAHG